MRAVEINSREEEVYKLSLLLRAPESDLWKWFRDGTALAQLSEEDYQFLWDLEYWFTLEADEDRVKEFNNFKESKTFTSIDQITELIQNTLNRKNFTFDNIIWLANEDTLISRIIEFYNFISMRMKKEDLASLFFSLCNSSEFREGHLSARTINANNHQCIWFKTGWPSDQPDSYQQGFHSTGDIFHTFVHEFCHALLYYLASTSINSETKSTFNIKDIFHNNNYESCKSLRDNINLSSRDNLEIFKTDDILKDYVDHMDSVYYNSNFNIGTKHITYSRLVNMVAVPSSYARSSMDEELICEAFAYWYLTPAEERNYFWALMHDFFYATIWQKWYGKLD